MSHLGNHVHGDDDSCRLVDYFNGRCYSMPHYTTTMTTSNKRPTTAATREINALTSPRRASDVDCLYRAYLGGEVQGSRLLELDPWKGHHFSRRYSHNNNDSWSEEDRNDTHRGFTLDEASGDVSLRGYTRSSRRQRHTDKVAGVTKRSETVVVSDDSISRHDERKEGEKKKKMKKKKNKGFWFSLFGC